MRVLLLNQVFHPDPQATGQYLTHLAQALVKQGHEVTVLTSRRDYVNPAVEHPARESWRGIEIIRVWNTGMGRSSKGGRMIDFLSFLMMAFLRGLFLRRVDVVVALTTPPLISVLGAILALKWRARLIYWVMDLNPDEAIAMGLLKADSAMARLLETASRWSLERAAQVIVLDIYMRDRLLAKGIPAEKIEVIPLWPQGSVAFDPEGRERFRRRHGLEKKFVVMYAGNHTPCHPLETLVEAAWLLRDEPRIHFCFVGGGLEWARWRKLAEVEGWGNATFLGYQPVEELSGLLSAADRQVVVMGDPFVGIIHPCKVYNFLAAQQPFIYLGPERSHVADLIRTAELESVTASYRHGEGRRLADDLRQQIDRASSSWPPGDRIQPWTEAVALAKMGAVF